MARSKKRLILRRLGRQARELDAVAAVLVDVLARFVAKVELLDRFYEGRGIVLEGGEAQPTLSVYFSALNGARLTAGRLAEHLARQGSPAEDLEGYIIEHYGPNGDGDAAA